MLPPVLRTLAFSHQKEMARSSWTAMRKMTQSTKLLAAISTLAQKIPHSVVENADERLLSLTLKLTSPRSGALNGKGNATSSERPEICKTRKASPVMMRWPSNIFRPGVLHLRSQAYRIKYIPILSVRPRTARRRKRRNRCYHQPHDRPMTWTRLTNSNRP
jgi:hypothetical protein